MWNLETFAMHFRRFCMPDRATEQAPFGVAVGRVPIAVNASRHGNKKLLRRSYCDAGRCMEKKTVAKRSSLSDEAIELLQGHLMGKRYPEAEDAFEVLRSRSDIPWKRGASRSASWGCRRCSLPGRAGCATRPAP